MKNLTKSARSLSLVGILMIGLVAAAGCESDSKFESKDSSPKAADAKANLQSASTHTGSATTLAGVSFTVPAGWSDIGATGMRQAQYRIDPVAGDSAEGEVNVFYFGPQSGGGVEANLDRWIGQMILPDGADPTTAIERGTFTANGMAGHIVSLNGSFKSGGGRPMGGNTEILPDYRLVGVVVEGPQGSLFFKLTGPEATARAMEKDLLAMVKNAQG